MRRLICMVGVLLAGCGGGDAAAPPGGGTTTTTVDVFTPGNIFSPFSTSITVGSTVNFNISGSSEGHNVLFHGAAGAPADINILITAKVSRTFNTKGTFPYDCSVHPGMTGQVIVQ